MTKLQDYDYELPESHIAQTPLDIRSNSKLLFCIDDNLIVKTFKDLPEFLENGDVIVLNNTKVNWVRIYCQKSTGAKIEVFITDVSQDQKAVALVKPLKKVPVGEVLETDSGIAITCIGRTEDNQAIFTLNDRTKDWQYVMENDGEVPLPPYIKTTLEDRNRYQTIYAKFVGSSAAPTAGLHFTEDLLKKIQAKGVKILYVTLHVGLGTFLPIVVDNIKDHKMHSEIYEIDPKTWDEILHAKEAGKKILSVGTTTLRTLESAYKFNKLSGSTDIFIYDGFKFNVVNYLLTNFHLPKSSLIVLLQAFMGTQWKKVYQFAIENDFRFLSFGDAMITKCQ